MVLASGRMSAAAVAIFLMLQALALLLAQPWVLSLLNVAAGLLAAGVAVACARQHGWGWAHGWSLLALSWLLWAMGALLGLQQRLAGTEAMFPALAGVVYLLGVLPLLLAISVVGLERRDPLLRWIDAVFLLALGAAYGGIRLQWFGTGFMAVDPVWMADLQNLFLVLMAGVRRAAAEQEDERRFFGLVFPFLLLRLLAVAAYNRLLEADPALASSGVRLLPSLPYLVFVWQAGRSVMPVKWPGAARLAPYARAASPLALTVLLLVTSALMVSRGGLAPGLAGIVLGVFGYGFRSTLLLVRTEAAAAQMHALARIDALTGIPNRRGFDEAVAQAWQHAASRGQPMTVLMIDIDHFKAINDRFGHTLGDDCLRLVAQVLDREKGEASAVVARVGGEEFAAMLPGMTLGQAMQLAERMRGAVQSVQSPLTEAGGVLTISIGLAAALPSEGTGVKSALIQADRLLYAAKRGGRNRVCGAALSGDAGEVVPA